MPHQGGYEVDAVGVVRVVDLDSADDLFVAASLDRGLECVRVVEVLHRLGAKVDAQLLQLARLRVLESKHVEDPDEPVGGVPDGVRQDGERLAGLLGPGGAHGGRVEARHFMVDRLVGAHGARKCSHGTFQTVRSFHNGRHCPAVQRLGKRVPGCVGHVGIGGGLDQLPSNLVSP